MPLTGMLLTGMLLTGALIGAAGALTGAGAQVSTAAGATRSGSGSRRRSAFFLMTGAWVGTSEPTGLIEPVEVDEKSLRRFRLTDSRTASATSTNSTQIT